MRYSFADVARFSGFAGLSGDKLVVAGDAAAVASNVLAHEVLLRSAIAANVIATFCYLVVTLLLYVLLKAVNRDLSLLAAFFGLMGCAVSGASFILNFAPLAVLGNQFLQPWLIDRGTTGIDRIDTRGVEVGTDHW